MDVGRARVALGANIGLLFFPTTWTIRLLGDGRNDDIFRHTCSCLLSVMTGHCINRQDSQHHSVYMGYSEP